MSAETQEQTREEMVESLNFNERRVLANIETAFVGLERYISDEGRDLLMRTKDAYTIAVTEGFDLARKTIEAATLIDEKMVELFGDLYGER